MSVRKDVESSIRRTLLDLVFIYFSLWVILRTVLDLTYYLI